MRRSARTHACRVPTHGDAISERPSAPPHLQFTYNQCISRPEVHMRKIKAKSRISRRTFIEATGAAAIAASAAPVLQAQNANVERTPGVPHTPIRVTINGKLQ